MSNVGLVVAGVSAPILAIIFGGIALNSLWIASDQSVYTSGDTRLQSVYEPSKQIIDATISIDDGRETVKAWITLIGLLGGGGFGIWLISKIEL